VEFSDAGAVTILVRHYRALEFLSTCFCGFVLPATEMGVDAHVHRG
jgi:hypothetical protein